MSESEADERRLLREGAGARELPRSTLRRIRVVEKARPPGLLWEVD